MPRILAIGLILTVLGGCTDFHLLGAAAIEKRRAINDLQARATMAAACDIAVGAYFRELSDLERRYVALVCGGPQTGSKPEKADVTLMRSMSELIRPQG